MSGDLATRDGDDLSEIVRFVVVRLVDYDPVPVDGVLKLRVVLHSAALQLSNNITYKCNVK